MWADQHEPWLCLICSGDPKGSELWKLLGTSKAPTGSSISREISCLPFTPAAGSSQNQWHVFRKALADIPDYLLSHHKHARRENHAVVRGREHGCQLAPWAPPALQTLAALSLSFSQSERKIQPICGQPDSGNSSVIPSHRCKDHTTPL